MTDSTYRFKEVMAILCRLNPDDKPDTVLSRVKQWQRMGIPEGGNVGRGVKCDYTLQMIWDMATINAFQKLGVPPASARNLMRQAEPEFTDDGMEFTTPHGKVVIDIERIAEALNVQLQEAA